MLEELKALKVGPDEVLVLHVDANDGVLGAEVDDYDALGDLQRALEDAGLKGRAVIVVGDIEFSVVKR